MFCCAGGGPKQLFEIKLWKSPTVNIGLASAIGKWGRMCKSHLDSFRSSAVIGRERCHPNRWWVLCALKDITHSPEETLQMLRQSKQNKGNMLLDLLLEWPWAISLYLYAVRLHVYVFLCDCIFIVCSIDLVYYDKLNNIGFCPNPFSHLPATRLDMHHFPTQWGISDLPTLLQCNAHVELTDLVTLANRIFHHNMHFIIPCKSSLSY